jgi:hypothetical protein
MKPFTSKHCTPINYGSPLERRSVSNKEKRLHEKLEKVKDKVADNYFEGPQKKQDRLERKELRVEQKLNRERKKQSRKSFGLEGSGADRKGDRQERKELRLQQKEFAERRKEREQK